MAAFMLRWRSSRLGQALQRAGQIAPGLAGADQPDIEARKAFRLALQSRGKRRAVAHEIAHPAEHGGGAAVRRLLGHQPQSAVQVLPGAEHAGEFARDIHQLPVPQRPVPPSSRASRPNPLPAGVDGRAPWRRVFCNLRGDFGRAGALADPCRSSPPRKAR